MGKTARVIVCGMKGVGKTAILEQAIYGNYTKDSVSICIKLRLKWLVGVCGDLTLVIC